MSDVVLCSICREPLPKLCPENAHLMVDRHVYKCGELQYIEIAHRQCEAHLDMKDDLEREHRLNMEALKYGDV